MSFAAFSGVEGGFSTEGHFVVSLGKSTSTGKKRQKNSETESARPSSRGEQRPGRREVMLPKTSRPGHSGNAA